MLRTEDDTLEPFFIRHGSFETFDAARSWAAAQYDKAISKGAKHARVSARPSGLVVEAWKQSTREVCFEFGPREGVPRWNEPERG